MRDQLLFEMKFSTSYCHSDSRISQAELYALKLMNEFELTCHLVFTVLTHSHSKLLLK